MGTNRRGPAIDGWAWGGRDGLPSRALVVDASGSVVGLARPGVPRLDIRATPPASPGTTLRLFAVSHEGRALCEISAGGSVMRPTL